METTKNYLTLKQEQKVLATDLHNQKHEISKTQKEGKVAGLLQCNLIYMKRDYRYKHIAYSLIRGRTYEQIETKCRKGNEPDQKTIQRIIDEYAHKDVCVSA